VDIEADWSTWLQERGEPVPLDEALHRIAREEGSEAPLASVTGALDRLARGLGSLSGVLRRLFEDEGFRGETDAYDDPRNSRIDLVLERRRGLPILLSAVTLEVGRRAGVDLVGVGFPGHFLVSTTRAPRRFFDPFHGGQERSPADLASRLPDQDPGALGLALSPISARDLLVRVSSNLVGSWMRRGSPLRALDHADRRVALRPDVPEFTRDRGLMRARLGLGEAAAFDLARYLELAPDAPDATSLRWMLSTLATSSPSA
jgi:regulator of sirC expression with transglutaminase-like and TPR domain